MLDYNSNLLDMQGSDFPGGCYYMIICKVGEQALRIQENDPTKFEKSRVVSTAPNPQDIGQLFMVQKVGEKDDQFQLVNCISTFVFDEQSGEIKLKYGRQSSDQLFAIVPATTANNKRYYWIKTDIKGAKALQLQGILRYSQFDQNNQSQLFRFQQVTYNNSNAIKNSAIIMNNMTGKAIDVPAATRKPGERIIQWKKNARWNQRWQFQRQGKGVIIKSSYNGLCLDIAGESKKSGSQVIQWTHTGGANQQWLPEPCGNGLYKFQSCHEPSLFLAIKNVKSSDGADLQVCNDENPTMYWRVEGAQP